MKNTKKQNENLTDAALLRQKAEELLQRKDKACLVSTDATSEADMLKLIHELEVHQIELEMQNEELVIAKEKAELAEEKYTELYDFAPSGYFTLSPHGNMLELNLLGAQMLCKERSLLINSQFGFFVKIDSRIVFAHFLEEIFRGKNSASCDVSLSCSDNNNLYVHLTGIISENGKHCHVTATDITERKKAEEELLKAKEKAEESESKLKAALESMSDAVFISDTDGNFLDFNDAFATFHKFKNKQECAKTFKEYPVFLDVYFPNGVLAPIEKWVVPSALRGEMGINKEFTLLRRDTNETWIGSYNYAPIRNNEGDVIGSVVTCRDITEIKLKENALRESEEMMRNSQSVAHICSYSTNLKVDDIAKSSWVCSPEFYQIFGIDKTYPHTIEGWAAFIHPDYRDKLVAYHEYVIKEKIPFEHEYKIIRINDGAERWVYGNGKLEFDEKGNPIRMHGAIQDITDRKQNEIEILKAKEKAEESELQFRSLFENAADAIFIADAESGIIVNANSKAVHLLNTSIDNIIGKHQSELHPPEMSDYSEATFQKHNVEIIEENIAYSVENYVLRSDGTQIPVEVTGSGVRYKDRDCIMGIFRDITERKQTELLIQKKTEEIEAQNVELKSVKVSLELCLEASQIGIWGHNLIEDPDLTCFQT